MARKYDKYIFNPPPVLFKTGDNGQIIWNSNVLNNTLTIPNLTLNYHLVTKPYISKSTPHTHNYQEFLAWYGCNLKDPEDFGAEIVLYLGEELEKYVITKSTLVSLPPGFSHCPMEITRVDRPIFQIAMTLDV